MWFGLNFCARVQLGRLCLLMKNFIFLLQAPARQLKNGAGWSHFFVQRGGCAEVVEVREALVLSLGG